MPRSIDLQPYPGFDPYRVADLYQQKTGLLTEVVRASNFCLVPTQKNAAIMCGDERKDLIKDVWDAPRMFGQTNKVAALKTGGDERGFVSAAQELRKLGYAPGTHKSCAAAELWIKGVLGEVIHGYELPFSADEVLNKAQQVGDYLKEIIEERYGGKHFKKVPGQHNGTEHLYNPFLDTTEATRDATRTKADGWLDARLGISIESAVGYDTQILKALPNIRRIIVLSN